MQIQVNADDNIQRPESLAEWVENELKGKLGRFRDHVTRIEVHLSDTNAGRVGDNDKRCTLEARTSGRPPVTVTHDAGSVADAVRGGGDKLARALDSAIGRARDARGTQTIRDVTPD